MELSRYITENFCEIEEEGTITRNNVAALVAASQEGKIDLHPQIWKTVCNFLLHPDINMAKDLPELTVT